MGLGHGTSIVRNGLVLHLDAANSKSKSYNVISNPENLSANLGLRAGASVTANAAVAPDGTQTADLLSTTQTDFGYYFPAFPVGNATHSFFLKPNGATNSFTFNHVGLARGGTFTFSTRTFSNLSNYTGSYEVLSNGWYLVNFHTTSELNIYYIEMSFDNASGAYVWGMQLTPFSYYLPYVPVSANKSQFLNNTLWQDISGKGNNGTISNGAIFSGESSGNITFDGSDDYVSANSGLINNADFTVSFWIKYQDSLVSDRGLMVSWDTSWNGFGIAASSFGGSFIRSWTNNGAGGGMNWDALSTIHNKWAYLALAYTFADKTQKAYINGIFKNSESYGTGVTHSTLQISRGGPTGSSQLSYYPYANCLIPIVSIYNRALSLAEIKQNFEATRGRYGV